MAVPPSSANGTSLPTPAATSRSSGGVRPARQSSLHATSVAAASALPPARPADTGIRLRISICTADLPRRCSPAARARAARAARLARPAGTEAASCPVTRTLVRSAGRTVTSSNSDTAWNTVTRSW